MRTSDERRHLRDGLQICQPPAWATGYISTDDALFLYDLVEASQPRVVLELGVAAGVSSAVLLYALDALGDDPRGPRVLHSADVRTTCYFDGARAVGSAVTELYPVHRTVWRLDCNADARRIRASLPPGQVDFAFVDATHDHPCPLLDVLHLAPWLRPGTWIALHDIALPKLYPQYKSIGAQWLYDAWPTDKLSGWPKAPNIGAVLRPPDLTTLIPMALDLVNDHRWQSTPRVADIDLPIVFGAVQAAIAPRLRPSWH